MVLQNMKVWSEIKKATWDRPGWKYINYITHRKTTQKCAVKHTENASNKADWKLRRKDGKKPRCSIQCRSDLVHLKVVVQIFVVVMKETRQLIHLHLKCQQRCDQCSNQPGCVRVPTSLTKKKDEQYKNVHKKSV